MKNIFVFALAICAIALLCCACNQSPAEPRISIIGFSKTPTGGGIFSGTITELAEKNFQISIQIEHQDHPSNTTVEAIILQDGNVQISGINGSKLHLYNKIELNDNGGAVFEIEVPDLPEYNWAAIAKATFFYPEDALESGVFIAPQ